MRLLFLILVVEAAHEDWREQHADGLKEDWFLTPLTLNYINFWYDFGMFSKPLSTNPNIPTCRQVIGFPPTATWTVHHSSTGSTLPAASREYTFGPRNIKALSLDRMSNCCTSSCGGIIDGKMVKMELGYFWDRSIPSPKTQVIHEAWCNLCIRSDAGPRNCSNGQYASAYIDIDDEGVVKAPVKCLPCPPGTWMTCAEKSSCAWPIPTSAAAYNPGRDFWMPKNPSGKYYIPVGTCLPCVSAGSSKSHYGDDPSKSSFIEATPSYEFTTTSPEARTVGLPWHCPGGAQAPRLCTVPDTQGDPLTSERCVCKAGFAITVSSTCATCPRGSRCNRGFADPCPDHTHQPNTGQTECLNCTSDGTERGVPMAYCGQGSQLRKCISVYKAAPLLCVNCNQCSKMYLSNNAGGKVDCYN